MTEEKMDKLQNLLGTKTQKEKGKSFHIKKKDIDLIKNSQSISKEQKNMWLNSTEIANNLCLWNCHTEDAKGGHALSKVKHRKPSM